jgi:hypothetical protein
MDLVRRPLWGEKRPGEAHSYTFMPRNMLVGVEWGIVELAVII